MDSSRLVRAAAVQLSPVLFSRDGTTEKVLQAIAQAAKEEVELIVFPETFIPYYPYFSFVQPPVLMGKEHMRLYEEAVTVPGPVPDAISRAGIPFWSFTTMRSAYIILPSVSVVIVIIISKPR